jgi:hypothetical protein
MEFRNQQPESKKYTFCSKLKSKQAEACILKNSVSDPDTFIPYPDPSFKAEYQPGPGFDDQK